MMLLLIFFEEIKEWNQKIIQPNAMLILAASLHQNIDRLKNKVIL